MTISPEKGPRLKNRSPILLSFVTGLICCLLLTGHHYIFSTYTPLYWLLGVTLFLFCYELVALRVVKKKIKTVNPQQMISWYMLIKGVRLFSFLFMILIYALAVQVEVKRFILIATVLYLFYLLADTVLLSRTERGSKTDKIVDNEKK